MPRQRFTQFSQMLMILILTIVALGQAVPATHAATDCDGPTMSYQVRRGDTLWRIARSFDSSVAELVCLNDIPNPNFIYSGQILQVPDHSAPPPPPPDPTSPVWTDPDANIELFSPLEDAPYHSPIEVIGFSRTFEGTVIIRLLDENGEEIAFRVAQGGSVDGYDFFHTTLRFVTNVQQNGTLEVYEESAQDGSRIGEIIIPVVLLPGQRVVDLEYPTVGQAVCDPILISGYSNTFEANVVVEVSDRAANGLNFVPTLGGNFGLYDVFWEQLEVGLTEPKPLLVSAFESNGIGIGTIDRTRVPVAAYPQGSEGCS